MFIPFTALYMYYILHLSYTLKTDHFENKPFIHSFIYLFIYSFIHSFIVKLCNQDVHIVSKEIYLCNYISGNIYDRAIKQTVCAFNAKSNQINVRINVKSMLDCFSLRKLHTTYCMSLYHMAVKYGTTIVDTLMKCL